MQESTNSMEINSENILTSQLELLNARTSGSFANRRLILFEILETISQETNCSDYLKNESHLTMIH